VAAGAVDEPKSPPPDETGALENKPPAGAGAPMLEPNPNPVLGGAAADPNVLLNPPTGTEAVPDAIPLLGVEKLVLFPNVWTVLLSAQVTTMLVGRISPRLQDGTFKAMARKDQTCHFSGLPDAYRYQRLQQNFLVRTSNSCTTVTVVKDDGRNAIVA
jgi:hypothetical protein